jgi:hypothetical protein
MRVTSHSSTNVTLRLIMSHRVEDVISSNFPFRQGKFFPLGLVRSLKIKHLAFW